jgi:hypothetical protein
VINFERGTIYRDVGPQRGERLCELSLIVNDGPWAPRRIAANAELDMASGKYDWRGFAAAVRREEGAPSYETEHILEPLRIISAMARAAESGRVELIERSGACDM